MRAVGVLLKASWLIIYNYFGPSRVTKVNKDWSSVATRFKSVIERYKTNFEFNALFGFHGYILLAF